MNTYLRNTVIISKNTHIFKAFKITKGTITKRINNFIILTYKANDIVALEYINELSDYDYYTEELTTGIWMDYDQILKEKLLINIIKTKNIHIELLSINDPIIAISRYIYYLYLEKKVDCFYLDKSISELSIYLKIEKRQLSKIITFLISEEIISRNNKLIIIQNLDKLKSLAFRIDTIPYNS